MRLSKQWKKFLKALLLTTPPAAITYALITTSTTLQASIAGTIFGLTFAAVYARYTKERTITFRRQNKQTYKQHLDAYLQARGFTQTTKDNNTYTYTNNSRLLPETITAKITRKQATITGPTPLIKRARKKQQRTGQTP